MDVPFTPHDDRPRSTPEPMQTYHRQDQTESTPVSVVTVHPSNGQMSDNDSSDRDDTVEVSLPRRRETIGSDLRPLINETNGNDEREDNGRPSSAPASTPTSTGHLVIDMATSAPRPHMSRPHISTIDSIPNDMTNMEPSSNPTDRANNSVSPDDPESNGLREAILQRYSELSPGPGGQPRYMCHLCRFSCDTLLLMRDHLMNHYDHKLKCTQCNYSTGEKTLFRRHKRLHQRTNPTSMLHCDKCQFSTQVPRRMREHYSFQHNEDFGTSFPHASMLVRSAAFNSNPSFSRMATGCSSDGGYFVDLNGSRALNSYRISQPRGPLQFEPGDPSSTVMSGCSNGGFSQPVGFPGFRNHSDRRGFPINHSAHLTLEYLFGHPRVSASSTITSCEYPARPSNPHRPDLNNFSPLRGSNPSSRDVFARQTISSPNRNRFSLPMADGETVKVKTEPIDCDGVSDVSSSGVPGLFERERGGQDQDRPQRSTAPEPTTSNSRCNRLLFEPTSPRRVAIDQSDEIATSGGDVSRVSQSSEAASSHMDARAGSVEDSEQDDRRGSGGDGDSLGHHLLFNIKAETSSVAVQCSGSSTMKSETLPTVTVAAAEHSTESRRHRMIERGVQCELLSSSPRRITSRTLSTDSEQQSVSGSDTRCLHCGITFDDEVLFSIHIGCHSHTDPFVCNVCGKKCHNKYGFYSHIMRGHHF